MTTFINGINGGRPPLLPSSHTRCLVSRWLLQYTQLTTAIYFAFLIACFFPSPFLKLPIPFVFAFSITLSFSLQYSLLRFSSFALYLSFVSLLVGTYSHMTHESRNSKLLGNGSVNTFPQKRTRATIEEPVSKQRIGKHTIGVLLKTVFSVRTAPRLYNKDLTRLDRIKSVSGEGKKGIRL
jgi:hypothetical protein